ncbi:MAG: hypothetical protein ACAH59_07490, partial [Pseudobdellovibrionaceae bacterium]
MKNSVKIKLGVAFAFLIFSYSNCGDPKNFISAPGDQNKNTSTVGNPFAKTSERVLASSCAVIVRCFPEVSVQQCSDGLSVTGGFAPVLGLSSAYDTLNSILQAENSGDLVGNTTATDSCSKQIEDLSCSEALVQSAYQPSLPNPYSSAPQMASASSCEQTFVPGVNLEVPIELVDKGLASRTTVATFERTRTSFNSDDYDGVVDRSFEIVASNADSVARSVQLLDSSGAVKATLSVPARSNNPTRVRGAFAATSGASNYRLQLSATASAGQLQVFAGRMLIRQENATQTKIYIPLTAGYRGDADSADTGAGALDKVNFLNYFQNNTQHYSQYRKNSAAYDKVADGTPWTLEVVMAAGGAGQTASAALINVSNNQAVAGSEISVTSSAPTLASASFADSAANFNDLQVIELQTKKPSTSSDGSLYRAGLWLKLTNLRHAEVLYRISSTLWWNSSSGSQSAPWNLTRLDL